MASLLKSNNQKVNPPNNIVAPKLILYQIFLFSKNDFLKCICVLLTYFKTWEDYCIFFFSLAAYEI